MTELTYKTGDVIVDDDNYTACAEWCNENNCVLEPVEVEGERKFKITPAPVITLEDDPTDISLEQRITDLEQALIEMYEGE